MSSLLLFGRLCRIVIRAFRGDGLHVEVRGVGQGGPEDLKNFTGVDIEVEGRGDVTILLAL